MTPKENLIAARNLLADPTKWTKGHLARTATGEGVGANDAEAVCFCTFGAMVKVDLPPDAYDGTPHSYTKALDLFREANGIKYAIGQWNDDPNRTYAEVIAAFDKAIGSL